jgi:hypothetical protein
MIKMNIAQKAEAEKKLSIVQRENSSLSEEKALQR